MAYSTNNSTAVSVTNFGVRLDGVTDNRNALQAAINSLYPNGGGSLFFPKGGCYWSGSINITGKNISFFGEDGSILRAAPDESTKKINISGASTISFDGLTIDYNRTGSVHDSNQKGFISTFNSSNIVIQNCQLQNSRNALIYLGGGTTGATIVSNSFSGHFCGVYGYINSGEAASSCFLITNNQFRDSWANGLIGEISDIKIQSFYGQTNKTSLHTVANNIFQNNLMMHVEFWKNAENIVVSNNTMESGMWGISLDNVKNATVSSNTIKAPSYIGIECATECENCIINGNTVNGFRGTGITNSSDRLTEGGFSSSNTLNKNISFSNNLVMGCTAAGAAFASNNNSLISDNIFIDNAINISIKNSSETKILGNTIDQRNCVVDSHIFVDASNLPMTGLMVSQNYFRGQLSYRGLNYYSPNGFGIINVLVENNFIDPLSSGFYGFVGYDYVPLNLLHRNNFTSSGANSFNSIPDYSTLPPGSLSYQTSAIQNGYQFYSTSTITIPSGGIPSSSGAWINISSGDAGGNVKEQRFIVKYAGGGPTYTFDNKQENLEFYTVIGPYGGGNGSITVMPQGNYGGNIVNEIWTDNPDGDVTATVWINISSGSIGTSGYQMTVYGSDSLLVGNPTVQFNRPNFTVNSVGVKLNSSNNKTLKTTYGIGIGTSGISEIYSPSSGNLSISANVGIGVTSPQYRLHVNGTVGLDGLTTTTSANGGPASALPAAPAGYLTINITGGDFKIPYYNI